MEVFAVLKHVLVLQRIIRVLLSKGRFVDVGSVRKDGSGKLVWTPSAGRRTGIF